MAKLMFDLNVADLQEKINLWPHSPHYKTLQLIKPGSRVLDVGCARGYMAEELKKTGCQIFGVEFDGKSCELARRHCEKVIQINIEEAEALPFAEGFFDYIICLDVLEHLQRPDLVLQRFKPYLAKGGEIIISLPNIARLEYRLALLFGNFGYGNSGILSKGHLRFFTRKTAGELIESSGYEIIREEPTGLGSITRILPNLLAFQFLFVVKIK